VAAALLENALRPVILLTEPILGGYFMTNLTLPHGVHNIGVNHALVLLLAVIMVTAAIKYLKN
jgi:hypothetical protein